MGRRARRRVPASVGMQVQKYGRTTGFTTGSINAVNVDVDVCYFPLTETICFPGYQAHFVNQFSIPAGSVPSAPREIPARSSSPGLEQPCRAAVRRRRRAHDRQADRCRAAALQRHDRRRAAERRPARPRQPASPPSPATGRSRSLGRRPASTAARRSRATRCTAERAPDPARRPDARLRRGTSYTDTSCGQRHDLLLQGVRGERGTARARRSNEALGDADRARRRRRRSLRRRQLQPRRTRPLSDAGRWTNGIVGSARPGCTSPRTCSPARSRRLAPRGATTPSTGPTSRSGRGSRRCPGSNNQLRLYARLQQPGSTYDGYMLRTNQLAGPTRSTSSASTTARLTRLLTITQELSAGDTCSSARRARSSRPGATTAAPGRGSASVHDTTYATAGYGRRRPARDDRPARRLRCADARSPRARPAPPTASAPRRRRPGRTVLDCAALRRRLADHGLQGVSRHEPGTRRRVLTTLPSRRRYTDTTAPNGTTYYYKVVRRERERRGPTSNEATATPRRRRCPRALLDSGRQLQPPEREPALRRGPLDERDHRRRDRLHTSPRTRSPARSHDDLHRLAQQRPVRPRRRGVGADHDLPGANNQLRLYARLQMPARRRRLHAAHEPAQRDRPGLPRALDNGAIVGC